MIKVASYSSEFVMRTSKTSREVRQATVAKKKNEFKNACFSFAPSGAHTAEDLHVGLKFR